MKLNDNNYILNCMIIVSIVGIIIKIFFKSSNYSDSSFWGLSIITLSLLVSLVVPLALTSELYKTNNYNLFMLLIKNALPSLSLIFILVYLIFLNVKYYESINKGINEDYNVFNLLSTIMVTLETFLIFYYLKKSIRNEYNNMLPPVIFIFSILNLVITGYMNIILDCFVTDG